MKTRTSPSNQNALMKPKVPSAVIRKAIDFAACAHRDQLRKGTNLPYIGHPFAVGVLLMQHEFPEAVIAGGILHDTLEDGGVTEETLAVEFSTEIAAIVAGCSEPNKSLPWRERKQHTIDSLRGASWQVKAVTAADKFDNLRAMTSDFAQSGEALWQRFKQGREQQEWYFRGVFQALLGANQGAPSGLNNLLGLLDDTLNGFFLRAGCSRAITISRDEAERCARDGTEDRCRWLLAVDPDTLHARFVGRDAAGFVADAQGHEDFFPVAMLFEQQDGFLEGGDWVVARTQALREHDGNYRSYRVTFS